MIPIAHTLPPVDSGCAHNDAAIEYHGVHFPMNRAQAHGTLSEAKKTRFPLRNRVAVYLRNAALRIKIG